MESEPLTVEDVVLTSIELQLLSDDTWRQLKIDPDAARRFLAEAGWTSKRFADEGAEAK